MPKLKTNSSAKKRFNLTSKGKVRATRSGKNHFMRRQTKDQVRNLRGTTILAEPESKHVKKHFLPYGSN
jgi:large subunit ribosomal protein L35